MASDGTDNSAGDEQTPQNYLSEGERGRVVRWQDPLIGARAGRKLAGHDYLQAWIDGALPIPPIAELMGFALVEVGDVRAVFRCAPGEYHYNPNGAVHGGLAATLLDSAMGCAIHTKLPAGIGYTTLELKVNYIRPLTSTTGIVTSEGKVIHLGSTIATAEGRITGAAGKLYAHATTTCLILRS